VKKLILFSLFFAILGVMVGCDNDPDPVYPNNRPDLDPYGTADICPELMINDNNSKILNLEQYDGSGTSQVWIRDLYVNYINGKYYATGTTKVKELTKAGPYNDGLYLWTADNLDGPWKLVETPAGKPKGRVWSPEDVTDNTAEKVVVADWQKYWEYKDKDKNIKAGHVWAPEIHYINNKWYIIACMGDSSLMPGSFILESEDGPAGPYKNIPGNIKTPLGDVVKVLTNLGGVSRNKYHIDGSLFEDEDKKVYLVLHHHLLYEMNSAITDIVPNTEPRIKQQSLYPGESLDKSVNDEDLISPYLEGAYILKYGGKYHLIQTIWSGKPANQDPDSPIVYKYATNDEFEKSKTYSKYSYDCIIATADNIDGPYSKRYTAGVGIGHNNLFVDKNGKLWSTFFKNPNFGQYANDPNAGVPGIIQMQWTGPTGNQIYVSPTLK